MAVALRPAVLLIVVASALFLVAGWLDATSGSQYTAIESYAFGAVNLVVAVAIARGNERILALRIGLAAFFMVERPITAAAFGPKPIEAIAVHLVTAALEAIILVSTLRLWRLGHSVSQTDLALLTLPALSSPLVATAGSAPAEVGVSAREPLPMSARKSEKRAKKPRERAPEPDLPLGTAPFRAGRLVGALALLLAFALVADALAAGVVPGVTVDLASTDWLGYVFALVVLIVAARAVHGGRFAIRLLLVVALITFVERAFTPFVTPIGVASLGLHAAAALLALGLAVLAAASLRTMRPRRPRAALPL